MRRALVAKAFYHVDLSRLGEWCSVLKTGMPVSEKPSDDSAAIAYRNYMMRTLGQAGNMVECDRYRKGQTALKQFIVRRPMSKLVCTHEDLFPLPE